MAEPEVPTDATSLTPNEVSFVFLYYKCNAHYRKKQRQH